MLTIGISPWPEPGHINATILLGRELLARGHTVKYLTKVEHEELFIERGLPFVHVTVPASPDAPRLEMDLHGFTPDVVLTDPVFSEEPMLLWRAGLTVIKLSTVFPMRFDRTLPPLCTTLLPPRDETVQKLVDAAWNDMHASNLKSDWTARHWLWARALGFPSEMIDERSSLAATFRLPEVVLVPEELDFPRAPSHDLFYAGPGVDLSRPEPTAFPFEWLRADLPLVYCAFGTQVRRYKRLTDHIELLIETARRLPELQFVVATAIERNVPTPANVLLVQTAPQLALLRRASLMISHGGLNSIKEALCLGVPMIVLPFDMDQPGNAARLVHHGLGAKAAWSSTTADELATLTRQVQRDAAERDRVQAVSARLHTALIEQHAACAVEACYARHRR